MKKNAEFNGESTFAEENTAALDADAIADEDELASSGLQTPSDTPGSPDKDDSGIAAVTEQVKDTAKQALGQGQQVAGQALDKAKDTVKSQLSTQKEKAVSTLGSFTDALMHTGDQLRQSGQGVFGGYAESIADRVDHVASYLRENDIDDLTAEVEDFARKQPALFIGGAFVVGIAIARFLKSSQSASTGTSSSDGSNPSYASTLPTPASAGALVTTNGESFGTPNKEEPFREEALPDNPPITAHDYVPGIGVTSNN